MNERPKQNNGERNSHRVHETVLESGDRCSNNYTLTATVAEDGGLQVNLKRCCHMKVNIPRLNGNRQVKPAMISDIRVR